MRSSGVFLVCAIVAQSCLGLPVVVTSESSAPLAIISPEPPDPKISKVPLELVIFFFASLLLLPIKTTIVRFVKVLTKDPIFSSVIDGLISIFLLGSIFMIMDKEDRAEDTIGNLLLSKLGVLWLFLVIASTLAGAFAPFTTRLYQHLSFLNGFASDLAFVVSIYLGVKNQDKFSVAVKSYSRNEWGLSVDWTEGDVLVAVLLYIFLNSILEAAMKTPSQPNASSFQPFRCPAPATDPHRSDNSVPGPIIEPPANPNYSLLETTGKAEIETVSESLSILLDSANRPAQLPQSTSTAEPKPDFLPIRPVFVPPAGVLFWSRIGCYEAVNGHRLAHKSCRNPATNSVSQPSFSPLEASGGLIPRRCKSDTVLYIED